MGLGGIPPPPPWTPWAEVAFWIPPPRQGDARGSADARSSTDACLSWQKVQRREANRRRHRLTELTTKTLCQPPLPHPKGSIPPMVHPGTPVTPPPPQKN